MEIHETGEQELPATAPGWTGRLGSALEEEEAAILSQRITVSARARAKQYVSVDGSRNTVHASWWCGRTSGRTLQNAGEYAARGRGRSSPINLVRNYAVVRGATARTGGCASRSLSRVGIYSDGSGGTEEERDPRI